MTDPRTAALRPPIEAVITRWYHLGLLRFNSHDDGSDDLLLRDEIAAAILAALPADWCGHIGVEEAVAQGQRMLAECEAESDEWERKWEMDAAVIARLREIEVASQQCSGSPKHFGGCGCLCHAALEEKP